MALWIETSVDETFWQGWNRKVQTNVDDNGCAQATYGAGDISTNNPDYPVEAGWIDVESGSQIALVNDGNWRQPESSIFKLLLRTGHGEVRDITSVIYGINRFDAGEEGASSYNGAFRKCKAEVEKLLG
ncbi:hypothetical protein [Corynebacterium amycolatum]|uniref:hypothetical protein n=1 Tax=Corynebacterium amycolatum TaxID=43765 RepID=UPI0012450337|nr:hypothetical protein [Corynebacterium amycolatum]KAA9224699.1 hypothetical protein F6I44_02945 [Corynebacterium amycolatum]MDK6443032.1 hypothetical protein [Corynebacterium amycolatum]